MGTATYRSLPLVTLSLHQHRAIASAPHLSFYNLLTSLRIWTRRRSTSCSREASGVLHRSLSASRWTPSRRAHKPRPVQSPSHALVDSRADICTVLQVACSYVSTRSASFGYVGHSKTYIERADGYPGPNPQKGRFLRVVQG